MSKLNQNLISKLNQYFQQTYGYYEYRRGWLKGVCPFCGRDDKFGIHLGLNTSNCFVCGEKHTPIHLVMHVESLSYKEALKFINVYEGFDYFYESIDSSAVGKIVEMPNSFKLISDGDSVIANKARDMVIRRGFKVETLSRKGFGYCTEGKYMGYLIMPFFHNGKVVYFHARRIINSGPKFNNPDRDEAGIGKSMALYNLDSLYMYQTIYMVESVMNAETLGDEGIAGGGKFWSDYQLSLLMRSPVKNIIIILDPDAVSESIKYCFYFFGHKNIKNVILPEGKDVNDLGKEFVSNKVEDTKWIRNHSDVMSLKLRYERTGVTYNSY